MEVHVWLEAVKGEHRLKPWLVEAVNKGSYVVPSLTSMVYPTSKITDHWNVLLYIGLYYVTHWDIFFQNHCLLFAFLLLCQTGERLYSPTCQCRELPQELANYCKWKRWLFNSKEVQHESQRAILSFTQERRRWQDILAQSLSHLLTELFDFMLSQPTQLWASKKGNDYLWTFIPL